jgi:hypothetical protein
MLNKNIWIQTEKILQQSLEPFSSEEAQALDKVFSARQAEVDDKLRKKADALRQRRARAKGDNAESVRWQVSFDMERLTKGGGLIDPDEVAPFVDCKYLSEYLTVTRMFAYAFRTTDDRDCPDIQAEETINEFMLRVQKLWYSAPLKTVMHFVGLDNCEFDDDLGFQRDEPVDWENGWTPGAVFNKALTSDEIAALPMVGKPVPVWKQQGFDSYKDWWEHEEIEKRKQKNREVLESHLRTKEEIDQDLSKTQTVEIKTPQLLYQGIITEH